MWPGIGSSVVALCVNKRRPSSSARPRAPRATTPAADRDVHHARDGRQRHRVKHDALVRGALDDPLLWWGYLPHQRKAERRAVLAHLVLPARPGLAAEQGEFGVRGEGLDLGLCGLFLNRLVYGRRAGQARAVLRDAHGQVGLSTCAARRTPSPVKRARGASSREPCIRTRRDLIGGRHHALTDLPIGQLDAVRVLDGVGQRRHALGRAFGHREDAVRLGYGDQLVVLVETRGDPPRPWKPRPASWASYRLRASWRTRRRARGRRPRPR